MMDGERHIVCPILIAGENKFVSKCIEDGCAWFDGSTRECYVVLFAKTFFRKREDEE